MKITDDFKFNKKFGQNFISDKNLLNAIVKDSGVSLHNDVLEIGAGAGTLTEVISKNCRKVVSYEIDKKLTQYLQDKFYDVPNVKIIIADCLKTNIDVIEADFENEYHIIANLPYYITTPLIFKFLEKTSKAKVITIMVQKEVAKKIVAKPNDENYGILSVMLQYYANVEITRIVKRTMFTPKPKVDSAIVKISRKEGVVFNADFSNFVSGCFAMKRKTLANNLLKMQYEKDRIQFAFKKLALNSAVRAENLTFDTIYDLYAILDKKI